MMSHRIVRPMAKVAHTVISRGLITQELMEPDASRVMEPMTSGV
jgi:hypothetical protein